MSASIRDSEASSEVGLLLHGDVAAAMHEGRGREPATQRTGRNRQRHHGGERRDPALAEDALVLGCLGLGIDAMVGPGPIADAT